MTDHRGHVVSEAERGDARLLWDYHQMHHTTRPCSVAIGLGSHDLGVATFSAQLYHSGLAPLLVFTGATSRTTAGRFPQGEAVHYREEALRLGVPDAAILVEPNATNTGQNIAFSRAVLDAAGIPVRSVLLVSKPYEERRSFATCRKVWPEVEVVCASQPIGFEDYAEAIGDEKLVIDMLVGASQRVIEYPAKGFTVAQEIPEEVLTAVARLSTAGFDSRLLRSETGMAP